MPGIRVICRNPDCMRSAEFMASLAGVNARCLHCGEDLVVPHGTRINGLLLNRFGLLKLVGTGAMGKVYESLDIETRQRVAVKVLDPELCHDRVVKGRFEREAEVAMRLRHPHIVEAYEAGEDQKRAYIAMEFMDGENVERKLRRKRRLPVADVLAIGASVISALAHAKEHGIIHRDVKPANILTDSTGRVKLADLGLVRVEDSETILTLSNLEMGTPLYMSPEQARDPRSADHRSDIYSLGVMLLYLSTGEHPFRRRSVLEVALAHRNDPIPSGRDLGTELPTGFDALVQKMAAKHPEARFQDYDTLESTLHDLHAKL
ncbi:MAG: serine/threonine-protein kinase [Limisphaerales bacterium]